MESQIVGPVVRINHLKVTAAVVCDLKAVKFKLTQHISQPYISEKGVEILHNNGKNVSSSSIFKTLF